MTGAAVRRVAVVGTGLIGTSWAAHFLAHGLDVVATDPAPVAHERLCAAVERLWPALTPVDGAAAERLHPERVVVGHPFNPPHVIPLVEVVPGERTDEAAVERAMAFYSGVGKKPIRLRAELRGHVANRLQAALWREAYSLVERGAATVADIDAAIAHGPGLRWAVLGPFVNQHLSGGPGGLAHVLEHLGPPTEEIWRDLGDPRMTPVLAARLVAGVDEELAGVDPDALVADRDAVLRALLAAKSATDLP